jgi:GGDEF domain-containing protein
MPPLHLAGIISASIGIAQHIPDAASTLSLDVEKTQLLKRADAAMYRAKSLGKNQVVVDHVARVQR